MISMVTLFNLDVMLLILMESGLNATLMYMFLVNIGQSK